MESLLGGGGGAVGGVKARVRKVEWEEERKRQVGGSTEERKDR